MNNHTMNNESCEKYLLPNGTEVLFYPEGHKYIVNGKEVPSITTLIQEHYGNMYTMVKPELLKAAADYGTKVHNELDRLITLRKKQSNIPLTSVFDEVNEYFNFIEPIYKIHPVLTERIVVLYGPNGEPAAAGRFDLLCTVKGELTLADFKTTSTIHRQSVSAQLNLYLTAAIQSGYFKKDEVQHLGVIHLLKTKSKFVPIQKFADNFYLTFII